MTTLRHLDRMLAIASALTIAACGGGSGTDTPDNGAPPTDNGTPPADNGVDDDQGAAGEVSHVVMAYDDATQVTYMVQVPDLAAETMSSFTGTSVPKLAVAVAFGDDPYFYVGSSDGPAVTRYEVTADGIVEDDEVSFENEGTTATGGYQSNLILVSRTKAYYIDQGNSQLVIWNPTTMTVSGTSSFDSINEVGARSGISGFPIRVGTKYFYGVGWFTMATLDVLHGAAVLVIDSADDSATLVRDEDERCGYSFSVVEGTDGLYVGTEAFGAAQHALSMGTAAPCMLRFDPDTLTFDDTYQVALESLVGDVPAGTLVPGPTAGTAYLRALDFATLGFTLDEWKTGGPSGTSMGNARVLSTQPAWAWYELTLGDTPTATLLTHARSSAATLGIELGAGQRVIPEYAGPRTHLRSFTGNTYGSVGLDAQGNVRSAVRVVVTP
ncbi:MAG: hypothetical protein R3B40_04735 [Polyangiales bacterium]|nr:hypothetical protein [Myxococcales bacterium]